MKYREVLLGSLSFFLVAVPLVAGYGFSISAPTGQASIGDTVVLNGSVQGLETTSVYLLVTGPGLDPDGATLEDIREAAGSLTGLFTTAQVNIGNGTFQYTWDTAPYKNIMQPGEYTVYVMAAPMSLDRLSIDGEPFASKTVLFLKTDETLPPTPTQSPLPSWIAAAALALAISGMMMIGRKDPGT